MPDFLDYEVKTPAPGATNRRSLSAAGRKLPSRSVTDHCLRGRNYVNVAGKQPAPVWLTMEQAIRHCTNGIGIWEWASNDQGGEPDVVMACCGDVPALEALAAVDLLRKHVPDLKVRVVNVVDLMKIQPLEEHPHRLPKSEFDAIFTTDKPIIFAFHGYPWTFTIATCIEISPIQTCIHTGRIRSLDAFNGCTTCRMARRTQSPTELRPSVLPRLACWPVWPTSGIGERLDRRPAKMPVDQTW
jgi:hypothetical protein